MNPVQRPLENVFKHVPIIMDLAVDSVINAIDTCTLASLPLSSIEHLWQQVFSVSYERIALYLC